MADRPETTSCQKSIYDRVCAACGHDCTEGPCPMEGEDKWVKTGRAIATAHAAKTTNDALVQRVAAAICNARVSANPDGCGGGAIGFHAIGEPGGCPECQAEARKAVEGDNGKRP